jgi:oligopeptide/dipeptide ABC transporter ATP-binding protein
LLASRRTGDGLNARTDDAATILRVEDLRKHFPSRKAVIRRTQRPIRAVDGVSFSLKRGEILGLVGESGCGKTTTAQLVVRLLDPTAGRIFFKGEDITEYDRRRMRPVRQHIQMVFQDPFASLNPNRSVQFAISEPLRIHGLYDDNQGWRLVAELLEKVGLQPTDAERYPHELSGGQRQRVAIARALALNPEVLILDEPVSSLDVSIQADIINLLLQLQEDLRLALLFVSHDLSVIRHVSDRIAVMYLGKIVETGTRDEIFQACTHPYTQVLLSAVPSMDPDQRRRETRITPRGELPDPANPPSGCSFRTRCFKADDMCALEEPALKDRFGHGHPSACHFAATLEETGERERAWE